jgi:hypothetical protein
VNATVTTARPDAVGTKPNFRHGIPTGGRSPDELKRLPSMAREVLVDHFAEVVDRE